jgi:ribosomal-protein-alanine N-acetyltransferase
MSPVLRMFRRPEVAPPRGLVRPGTVMLRDAPIPARATPNPLDPLLAMLVVLDGASVPAPQHYRVWSSTLAARGFTALRTGALSQRQSAQAALADLECVQELTLLELTELDHRSRHTPVTGRRRRSTVRTRRMTSDDLEAISLIDRASFGDRWWLDAALLADICTATPRYRARVSLDGRTITGFLLSGRSGATGYIQRLAVTPAGRRQGIAAALLDDAFTWMHRAGGTRVYVNTHIDNDAALALYHRHGFHDMTERLSVFEGPTVP